MNTKLGAWRSRARTPRPQPHYDVLDGERVIIIYLPNGQRVIISPDTWADYVCAHYSKNLFPRDNGSGRSYPSVEALAPDGSSSPRSVIRIVAALIMLREERNGGPKAVAKGWIAKPANRDPLDLRDSNIVIEPATRRRNSHMAVWDARARLKLVDEGKDPNAVFAERRRAKRDGAK
ncbi:MAG TPA: hypothetical protein VG407_16240 [Caulobacteraceae bacterium]|jgi:hypothetical protein|nr:hypothetical protein [Caulobacteraceae bacterium]